MKKTLTAFLAAIAVALGLGLVAAPTAQALDYNNFNGPQWQPSQPTITVSDRNGYDLNENEAATWWGIYGATDAVDMIYTQYETCDYCIRIYTAPLAANTLGDAHITSYYYKQVSTSSGIATYKYPRQCDIRIDPDQTGPNATKRQTVVTHEIGHCLGFVHTTGYSIMQTPYSAIAYDGITQPTGNDYELLRRYYPSATTAWQCDYC